MPLNNGATNEILQFGHGAGANVMTQAEYLADVARTAGNQSGLARSKFVNKIWRQGAHLVAGVGQWIANRYAPGVRDNGDLDAIEAGMTAAVRSCAATSWPLMVLDWDAVTNYARKTLVFGPDGRIYIWLRGSGPGVGGVGAKQPGAAGNEGFWLDFVASLASVIPAGVPRGAVCSFHKVVFAGSDGRRPIFWGQTVADEGWVLADGGSDGAGGNVPNLRDRMIMGAGGSYAAGATGGAATHSHNVSGSAGGATLSVAQLASHSHSYRTNSSTGSVQNDGTALEYPENQNTGATGGSQAHSHSLSASAAAANGLPPFYALAICVKI